MENQYAYTKKVTENLAKILPKAEPDACFLFVKDKLALNWLPPWGI